MHCHKPRTQAVPHTWEWWRPRYSYGNMQVILYSKWFIITKCCFVHENQNNSQKEYQACCDLSFHRLVAWCKSVACFLLWRPPIRAQACLDFWRVEFSLKGSNTDVRIFPPLFSPISYTPRPRVSRILSTLFSWAKLKIRRSLTPAASYAMCEAEYDWLTDFSSPR